MPGNKEKSSAKLGTSISMNGISNASRKALAQQQIVRVVLLCKCCRMVFIGERRRVICSYCGTFYDSKVEEELNKNVQKSVKPPRPGKEGNEDEEDDDDDEGSTGSSSANEGDGRDKNSGSKIKQFLKNLLTRKDSLPTSTSSNSLAKTKHLALKKQTSLASAEANADPTSCQAEQNGAYRIGQKNEPVVEITDLKHPFLSIKNKYPNFYQEYSTTMIKSSEEFRGHFKASIESKNFDKIKDFYCWTYSKAKNLTDLLVNKKTESVLVDMPTSSKNSDPNYGLSTNWRFMKEIHNCLRICPDEVQKLVLMAISFMMANDLKPMADKLRSIMIAEHKNGLKTKEKSSNQKSQSGEQEIKHELIKQLVNTYVILLSNPLLDEIENFTLLSVIFSEIASFNNQAQSSLIFVMRKIPLVFFRDILNRIKYFIEIGHFPSRWTKTPPLVPNWLSTSVKVMALLHCTNEMQIQYYKHHHMDYASDALKQSKSATKPVQVAEDDEQAEASQSLASILTPSSTSSSLFISYQEFYMKQLDNLDLYKEYLIWQKIDRVESEFSFCQYPFLLSLSAKRKILERDSEQQMIQVAQKSVRENAKNRRDIPPNDLFLTVRVTRENLVSDSMTQIQLKKSELKKKLRVNFIGEAAIDMGGVRKEWFLLLVRKLFSPVYGMFEYIKDSGVYWFTMSPAISLAEYNLIGVVMGLAVYNGEMLDIRFPPCVYKKLLSPEIVPFDDKQATVGLVKTFTLLDLKYIMPSLASSLQNLLDYKGDVKEDFMMNFQISYSAFDVVHSVSLKENGEKIEITNENRKEFVDLYVDFLLNKSIYEKFKAFYYGFHSVCASNALILLRPEEIESLVCGSTENLNINELKSITMYDGYKESDEIIKWFWEIISDEFVPSEQKRLLLFATGSDRIPIGGIREMTFKIIRVEPKNQLPTSHTCFNQLVLPNYNSKEILKSKLSIAIENAEGFGFK